MKFGIDADGNPIAEPLKSLDELLQWNSDEFTFSGINLNGEPRNPIGSQTVGKHKTGPKLLVCHDMLGGYLDDSFVQGCVPSAPPYRFYHWQYLDTFVYFSHHFITIPPVGWIQAAHKHGVRILGTIITEWDEGVQNCSDILKTEESVEQITSKLAEIASYFGFNGWLINIENGIQANQVRRMQSFVRTLTTKCHELLDSGQVLWYDSVTSKGDLRWQDELNSLNKMFFDVCDGIYLNYNITEEKLARSRDLAALANRQFDVYVGIDVFGRGSPCGGGFNTKEVRSSLNLYSKEGLEMIRNYQLSCALFAPAWTYEYLGYADFDVNEIMFWGIISELLTIRPLKIPIYTTFCQGFGNDFFLQGQKMNVLSKPWFNISLQQLQPSYLQSQFHSYVITSTIDTELDDHEIPVQRKRSQASYKVQNQSKPSMFLDLTSAVNGGGSLKLQALNKGQAVWFKLFKIDADNSKCLRLTVCWKRSPVSRCDVIVVLSTLDADSVGVGPVGVLLETVAFSESHLPFLEQASKNCLRHISTAAPETESLLQDYRRSSFMVDMNEFVKRGYKDQEFLVSAVLLPLADPQMAVNIGLLEVVGDSEVKPRLNIMKAIVSLGKQLELPLSLDRIIDLITKVNTSYQDIVTAETRSNSVVSADATGTAMSSARTSVTSENSSFASESIMVYFFKWTYSNQADVDYYLVSGYDMAGRRTILGHCVTENFIYTHALNDAMLLPDHFSIEPVLSSTDSPAGEFLFYAEGAVPRVTDLTF